MSRAFVREDAPDTAPLPDLPVSAHPNHVTPRGLAQLQVRLAGAQAALAAARARPDRSDRLPEQIAERDIRYLAARLATAIPVPPAPTDAVAFGHAVTVEDEDGALATYEITGEDEADASACRIAPQSPLARALIGARVGDSVDWRRPNGTVALTIRAIGLTP
jgi:transcription elongation GreA/GreB family factor